MFLSYVKEIFIDKIYTQVFLEKDMLRVLCVLSLAIVRKTIIFLLLLARATDQQLALQRLQVHVKTQSCNQNLHISCALYEPLPTCST